LVERVHRGYPDALEVQQDSAKSMIQLHIAARESNELAYVTTPDVGLSHCHCFDAASDAEIVGCTGNTFNGRSCPRTKIAMTGIDLVTNFFQVVISTITRLVPINIDKALLPMTFTSVMSHDDTLGAKTPFGATSSFSTQSVANTIDVLMMIHFAVKVSHIN
jgi:hypothetical protein